MLQKEYALVIGSLHLDVISTSKDKPGVFHRKGLTKIHFGGAGRNAAVNLAQLSMPVLFIGISNGSPLARLSVDEALFEKADKTLYEAKTGDRNRVCIANE